MIFKEQFYVTAQLRGKHRDFSTHAVSHTCVPPTINVPPKMVCLLQGMGLHDVCPSPRASFAPGSGDRQRPALSQLSPRAVRPLSPFLLRAQPRPEKQFFPVKIDFLQFTHLVLLGGPGFTGCLHSQSPPRPPAHSPLEPTGHQELPTPSSPAVLMAEARSPHR